MRTSARVLVFVTLVTMLILPAMALAGPTDITNLDRTITPNPVGVGQSATVRLSMEGNACQVSTSGADVALVMDRSGSMYLSCSGSGCPTPPEDRIGPAIAAATGFLQRMDFSRDQGTIVPFAGTASVTAPLGSSQVQLTNALEALRGTPGTDGTAIGSGISVARGELLGPRQNPNNARAMIVLSYKEWIMQRSKIEWHALLWLTLLVTALITWPVWRWLWGEWQKNEYYSHGFLIVPIALFIAWRQLRQPRDEAWSPAQGDSRGLVLLGVSLAVLVAMLFNRAYYMAAFAMIGLIGGLIWTFGGRRIARQLAFPIIFLALMVPVPFIEQMTLPLASFTGLASSALMNLLGLDIVITGSAVTLPNVANLMFFADAWGVDTAFKLYHDYSGIVIFLLVLLLMKPLTRMLQCTAVRSDIF